jgi:hypothetical protein
MALHSKNEIHPKLANATPASSFHPQPVPKYQVPKAGIERAAAYQLVHDELLLDARSQPDHARVFRQEHDR